MAIVLGTPRKGPCGGRQSLKERNFRISAAFFMFMVGVMRCRKLQS